MDTLAPLLWGVLVPALIAAVACAAAAFLSRPWIAGCGVALGVMAAQAGLEGIPPFPAIRAESWIFWAGCLLLLSGLLPDEPKLATGIVRALIVTSATAITVRPLMQNVWSARETAIWLVVSVLLGCACWYGVRRLAADHNTGAKFPQLMMLYGTMLAVLLVLGSSATLAQLAGALVATLGAAMVAGLLWRSVEFAAVLVTPLVVVIVLLVTNGHHYGYVDRSTSGLFMLAPPLAAWLGSRIAHARRFWVQGLVLALFCAALLAIELMGQTERTGYTP
jgi:hypothetical protein